VAFLGALALIVVKGFVSTDKVANFLASPAVVSAPLPVNPRNPNPPSPDPPLPL